MSRPGVGTYWRTVRHLKPGQTFGRVLYNLRRPSLRPGLPPGVRVQDRPFEGCIAKEEHHRTGSTWSMLNRAVDITDPTIWNDPAQEKLWLYHLHYFETLLAPEREGSADLRVALMDRWMVENPVGQGCGWEPYPISLRTVNWIKWHLLGHPLSAGQLASLADQLRFLCKRLEWHIRGNHLFENAKALIFGGLFFAGSEAEVWYRKGRKILTDQLREQLLEDGFHFERTPMYHNLVAEGLLDLANLHQCYGREAPGSLVPALQSMLDALEVVVHDDGQLAFFNDTTLGAAASRQELLAYGKRLDLVVARRTLAPIEFLREAGYGRVSRGDARLFVDVGDLGPSYLPGHAHADTLSFELDLGGQRVLVNSGLSSYQDPSVRAYERSTAAHNTVEIDGKNSSEVWAFFRVGRRARGQLLALESDVSSDRIRAHHDGYRFIARDLRHTRSWVLTDAGLDVEDLILGSAGTHQVRSFFHFHPDLELQAESKHRFAFHDSVSGLCGSISLDAQIEEVAMLKTSYGRAFGDRRPKVCLQGSCRAPLPLTLHTEIRW